jgi:hypothetical protein
VAAEVEGLELDLADAQLLRRRVLRRLVLHEPLRSDPIRAEHAQPPRNQIGSGIPSSKGTAKKVRVSRVERKASDTNLVLEHVEEGGLAGVVEAEEEDLGVLLPQTQRGQHPVEPIHQEHLCLSAPAISSLLTVLAAQDRPTPSARFLPFLFPSSLRVLTGTNFLLLVAGLCSRFFGGATCF